MEVGGYRKQVDLSKLGPTLVIASSLVLAIRIAKWPRHTVATASSPEWDAEVIHSVEIANRSVAFDIEVADTVSAKDVPWYQPSEDDSPK